MIVIVNGSPTAVDGLQSFGGSKIPLVWRLHRSCLRTGRHGEEETPSCSKFCSCCPEGRLKLMNCDVSNGQTLLPR